MKQRSQISAVVILSFAAVVSTVAQRRTDIVKVNLTVDDTASVTAGVRSVGGQDYNNGSSSVEAGFQANGYFVFNAGTRLMSFIYSTPLNAQAVLPNDIDIAGVKARTYPINTNDFIPIQNMQQGQSQCLGMTWEYSPGTSLTRNVSYHYGTGDQSQTAYVTVTFDGAVWTIEPVNQANCGSGDSAFNNSAIVKTTTKVKNKVSGVAENGHYFMPFRLLISKQP